MTANAGIHRAAEGRPVDSEQYQDAEAFLQRHICAAIERHKNMNSERGAEAAKEYLDNIMREAA